MFKIRKRSGKPSKPAPPIVDDANPGEVQPNCVKRRFPDYDSAKVRALEIELAGRAPVKMGVYRCRVCGRFHLSTQAGQKTSDNLTLQQRRIVAAFFLQRLRGSRRKW